MNKVIYYASRAKNAIINLMKLLCKSKLLAWIRSSLLYNILKIFAITIALIWLLFQFTPKTAYIYADTNEMDFLTASTKSVLANISSTTMYIDTEKNFSVSIDDEIIINDTKYNGDIVLRFVAKEGLFNRIKLSPIAKNEISNMYIVRIFDNGNHHQFSLSDIENTINVTDRFTLETQGAISLNCDDYFLTLEYGDESLMLENEFTLSPVNDNLIMDFDTTATSITVMGESDITIKFSKADMIRYGGYGEVVFSILPTETKHRIDFRPVLVVDDSSRLNGYATHTKDGGLVSFYGNANKATLSDHNIFPNFVTVKQKGANPGKEESAS